MIPANAPAFRLFFNTGKRAVETGAAWPNRAGTGFNVQLDSLFGSRTLFMVPNLDRDGQPAGAAPFRILYATGRIRADGSQHSRVGGVAHVSRDGHGYDLYVADPVACLRLTLRPPADPAQAANDAPAGEQAVSAGDTRYDAETGEVVEDSAAPPDGERRAGRRRACSA
ncbi:MAG TPA: hypothetical protein VEG34_17290 [Thermoanaerobaculia bacterium]|jgi:hypothetical protein|nr:hypothetical protein [Thermoanaerobaculia bacterium]